MAVCAPSKPCARCKKRKRYNRSYCRLCTNELAREWRRSNPERRRATVRRMNWKAKYGVTEEMYNAMLAAQDGVCAICKREDLAGHALHVDHDHACCPGKTSCGRCVRGLLCGKCNRLLGCADESIETLKAAARYIRARSLCNV